MTERPTPPGAFQHTEVPVPKSELVRGASKDGIPAIVDPAFGDGWTDVDVTDRDTHEGADSELIAGFPADDRVIGIERGGEARAYPLRVLNGHEIVNDDLDGPLLVTYCPLCDSGVTADRVVGGEPSRFGVSGFLWHSDLVMYDEATESLWSQIMATAIHGPRTGDVLPLVPSTMTTWRSWREAKPETSLLLPPPHSGTIVGEIRRNYGNDPFQEYKRSEGVGVGGDDEDYDDERLHPKTLVAGISHEGINRAYPLPAVLEAGGVVNDTAGSRPVVVATLPDDELVAYERRVAGSTVRFEGDGDRHLAAAGSRWDRATGRAVDGPHEGTRLDSATRTTSLFWFAWAAFHPDTEIYGGPRPDTTPLP
jgi:hypothetical protein